MNKVFGKKTDFAPIKEDASRVIISYGYVEVDEENAAWLEIYMYKKQISQISLSDVKTAILADIDKRTDEKILNGYPFMPDGAEDPVIVWLSKESQTNFSEAHRLQIVPVKFKLNETEDKQPIYHTFTDFDELDRFYKGGVRWINQCLNEGWAEKDGINWAPYEEHFPEAGANTAAE